LICLRPPIKDVQPVSFNMRSVFSLGSEFHEFSWPWRLLCDYRPIRTGIGNHSCERDLRITILFLRVQSRKSSAFRKCHQLISYVAHRFLAPEPGLPGGAAVSGGETARALFWRTFFYFAYSARCALSAPDSEVSQRMLASNRRRPTQRGANGWCKFAVASRTAPSVRRPRSGTGRIFPKNAAGFLMGFRF
jgi:hypothetical protein